MPLSVQHQLSLRRVPDSLDPTAGRVIRKVGQTDWKTEHSALERVTIKARDLDIHICFEHFRHWES